MNLFPATVSIQEAKAADYVTRIKRLKGLKSRIIYFIKSFHSHLSFDRYWTVQTRPAQLFISAGNCDKI